MRKRITQKDTIKIEDRIFVISNIQHPDIVLSRVGILADSSHIGAAFPVVYAKNSDLKNNLKINDLIKNKYVFIDFWGSWCGPCIASIPKLKTFYEKVKDRDDVLLLGIALEEEREIEKLKKIIDREQIEWTNLVTLKKESNVSSSIIKRLDILRYPTYMIIDNKGKIVYKEESMQNSQEAIDLFMKLIDE